jgi:hypothetical protein
MLEHEKRGNKDRWFHRLFKPCLSEKTEYPIGLCSALACGVCSLYGCWSVIDRQSTVFLQRRAFIGLASQLMYAKVARFQLSFPFSASVISVACLICVTKQTCIEIVGQGWQASVQHTLGPVWCHLQTVLPTGLHAVKSYKVTAKSQKDLADESRGAIMDVASSPLHALLPSSPESFCVNIERRMPGMSMSSPSV